VSISGASLSAYGAGAGLGASLIVAIGAQNACVLRQGLLRREVGVTVAVCAAFDVLLIGVGVAGMGGIIGRSPVALLVARWAGAAFLCVYGARAFAAAWRGGARMQTGASAQGSRLATALAVVLLSALNPHVYLDTVLLLGSVGGRLPASQRPWFAAGAMSASVLWFSALGYGARFLAPVFARQSAWRILDVCIGVVMWVIALALLRGY
jgi:L-lysine exporter family protein LysE/ArgO